VKLLARASSICIMRHSCSSNVRDAHAAHALRARTAAYIMPVADWLTAVKMI
jgi:hypothetical protein